MWSRSCCTDSGSTAHYQCKSYHQCPSLAPPMHAWHPIHAWHPPACLAPPCMPWHPHACFPTKGSSHSRFSAQPQLCVLKYSFNGTKLLPNAKGSRLPCPCRNAWQVNLGDRHADMGRMHIMLKSMVARVMCEHVIKVFVSCC